MSDPPDSCAAAAEEALMLNTRNSETALDGVGGEKEKTDSERVNNTCTLSSTDASLPTDECSTSKFAQCETPTNDEGCRFAKPTTFLCFLCLLVIAQSCVVIGYSSSIQTSLQKQFGFTTNQYGVIVSSFEYTSIPSVVLISFFGHRRNRARLIGYGSLLISIGCGVYVLPFVFSLRNGVHYSMSARSANGRQLTIDSQDENDSWSVSDANAQLCDMNTADARWHANGPIASGNFSVVLSNESTPPEAVLLSTSASTLPPTCEPTTDASFSSAMFGLLVGAQMILGVGSSPIYTLGPTYLYDAVSKTRYAALISLVYASSALGPALGFLMGALCLTVYITPWRAPPSASQADFVGAWWIGLLVCCAVSLAAGLPLILFPKRLRSCTRTRCAPSNGRVQPPAGVDSACGSQSGESRSTLVSSASFSRRSTVTIIGKNGEDWTAGADADADADECVSEPPAHAGFGNKRSWTQIGPGLRRLFASRIWLCVSLCLIAENSIVTGFVTYLAKYLQTVFYVATNYASVIAGVILIPAAVTGFLAGGVITQRVLVDTRRATLYLLFVAIATLVLLVPLGFLHCDAPRLAGVTVGYPEQPAGPLYDTLSSLAVSLQLAAAGVGVGVGVSSHAEASRAESNYSLFAACSAPCGCSTQQYAPICAEVRGVRTSFYSACFAGCTLATNYSYASQTESSMLFYYNCSCVPASFVHPYSNWTMNVSWPASTAVTLTDGSCDTMCALIAPFLGIMFAIVFLVSSAQNSVLILTLQSASPDDRSFALGVQNFFIRMAAFIPSPIYFGALFDAWCILWSAPASAPSPATCAAAPDADTGVSARYCLLTDIVALPYVLVGCSVLLKLFSVAACTCCWLSARSHRAVELDCTSAQSASASACASVVSSAPSCISDLPIGSRESAVRCSARQFENAAVAYHSKRPAATLQLSEAEAPESATPSVTLVTTRPCSQRS